jgi:hypothetical protein
MLALSLLGTLLWCMRQAIVALAIRNISGSA